MRYLFQFLGTDFFEVYGICFGVLFAVVHVCFAVAVYCDARRLTGKPILVWPIVWSFATLLGGVIVAAVYWVIHHSRLNQWIDERPPIDADESQDM